MSDDAGPQQAPPVVLVVDDDPMVRGLMARALVEEGFPVVTAESGEEALVVAQALEGDLPLVVTDIRMPGMDGVEMAERLVQLRRARRVLFVSGYTPPVSLLGPLLNRPFSPQALVDALRRMLSDSVPPSAGPAPVT